MTNAFFTELARCLRKQGIDSEIQKDRRLEIFLHGQPALFVSPKNEVFMLPEMSGNDETGDLYHEVAQISNEVFSYPDATYVGRACYVRLSEMNRAKIQFISTHIASQYDALRLTILNRDEGAVDNLVLRFSDLLGKKHTSNPNFRDGVIPHLWDDCGKVAWYVYQPSSRDYQELSDAVGSYLEVFQEQVQMERPGWEQTM